jgi:hypothetical protein
VHGCCCCVLRCRACVCMSKADCCQRGRTGCRMLYRLSWQHSSAEPAATSCSWRASRCVQTRRLGSWFRLDQGWRAGPRCEHRQLKAGMHRYVRHTLYILNLLLRTSCWMFLLCGKYWHTGSAQTDLPDERHAVLCLVPWCVCAGG